MRHTSKREVYRQTIMLVEDLHRIAGTGMTGVDEICTRIAGLLVTTGGPILVAIDGRSGTGKSTLARRIGDRTGATVIAGDDFYSGGSDAEWARQSPEMRVANCVDWRRMRREVLEPLLAGKAAAWHPFNFAAGTGLADRLIEQEPAEVIVLDGAYSARPELRDLIDLAVLVEMPDDAARRERLIRREGPEFMAGWHAIWDDAEDFYFSQVVPPAWFDLVVRGQEDS